MRTTVDIPDSLYRELKMRAAQRGCSVKDIVLRGVRFVLKDVDTGKASLKTKLPVIQSKSPGRLKLTNEEIDDLLFS